MKARRLHRRRLLDLHRGVRRRRQPGRPAQARHEQSLGRARVGLGVAGEPAHPLQPRLRRPGRQAVERAQGLRLVGRGEGSEWTGHDVPDFEKTKPPSYRPPRGAVGRRRASPATTRSSCRATARAGCTRPPGCSTGRCPRTTSRSSRRCATRSTGSRPTRPARCTTAPTTRSTRAPPERAQRGLPVRVHHQPAHRAPHRRRDEPASSPYLAELQPEMFVEVSPELAARARAGAPGLGARRHRPGGDRGAGAGDRPAARRCGSTAGSIHQIWLPYHWGGERPGHRRLGQRPVRHHARPERAHPGEQGRHLRHPARPPAHRPGAAASSSPTTGGGPGTVDAASSPRRRRRHGTDGRRRPATRPGGLIDGQPTACTGRSTRRPTPATPTRRRGWASSPTPASASAARPARWPARSGTASRRTASTCSACPTTTPAR